jgi:phosphoesterase RecJ-like protein
LYRFGDLAERHSIFLEHVPILNIDHHVSSSGCGQVNIIEPQAAATAELLVLFQQQGHLPINKDAAMCLLTGLITDTGSFQYSNTTPRTMVTGATLLQAGAIPEIIVKPIFRTHPLPQARLQSVVIANARTAYNGRLIWSYATEETLAAAGADANMDDGFSSVLRDIEGVQIAAFFKNYNNAPETRLSLRSEAPYNVAEFCMRFGGGGHPRAAGAIIKKPLAEAMELVIGELQKELN